MAPRWLRLVISWLVRVRQQQKPSAKPQGPRRRASFPVYQPPRPTTPSANPPSAAPNNQAAYGSLPSRNKRRSTQTNSTPNGQFYVPPGYIYHTGHGWIPVGNGQVTYAPGYQGHITGAATSTPYRRLPNGQIVATTGYIPISNGVQQHQFYIFPQHTATQGQPGMMSQVSNSAPVTLPKIPKEKSTSSAAPHSRTSSYQATAPPPTPATHRPAPPPPPPRRQPARKPRANSAPAPSAPYHASPRRIADAWARYQKFFTSSHSSRPITFDKIPWPMVDPPRHPTSLTVNSVRSFLLSPHHSQDVPARERVETAQRQWEQVAFMTNYGPKMAPEDKEKIERTVGFLQGTLRLLHYEVVAAESVEDGSS